MCFQRRSGTLAAMTTTPTHHLATVADLYAAFGRGDIPAILDALAEDVRWEQWDDNTAQREGVSHLQARIGRDGVAAFFASIGEIEFHTFEVRGLTAGDDWVVADILIEVTLPSGGRMRDEELHLWRFDADGRICAMRHYVDTAKHIAAERGQDTIARAQQRERDIRLEDDNKQIVGRLFDALNQANLGALDDLVAADVSVHIPLPGDWAGREGFRRLAGAFLAAFPGTQTEVYGLIAEGDRVVALHTHRGTHTGELMGIAPTGREVRVTGIETFRVADGMIAEFWQAEDHLGLFQQLGVVAETAA